MHAEVVGRTNIFASFGLPIIATTFHDPVFPNMPSLTRNSHDLGEFILGIFIIIPCTTMHLIVRRCVYVSYREFLEHLGGIPGTPDSPFIHLCISITITTIPELPKKMPNCRLVHCHHIRSNIDALLHTPTTPRGPRIIFPTSIWDHSRKWRSIEALDCKISRKLLPGSSRLKPQTWWVPAPFWSPSKGLKPQTLTLIPHLYIPFYFSSENMDFCQKVLSN